MEVDLREHFSHSNLPKCARNTDIAGQIDCQNLTGTFIVTRTTSVFRNNENGNAGPNAIKTFTSHACLVECNYHPHGHHFLAGSQEDSSLCQGGPDDSWSPLIQSWNLRSR